MATENGSGDYSGNILVHVVQPLVALAGKTIRTTHGENLLPHRTGSQPRSPHRHGRLHRPAVTGDIVNLRRGAVVRPPAKGIDLSIQFRNVARFPSRRLRRQLFPRADARIQHEKFPAKLGLIVAVATYRDATYRDATYRVDDAIDSDYVDSLS